MAISIKNHEDRITALENKLSSSNVTYEVLNTGGLSGNYLKVTKPLNQFDFFMVEFLTGSGVYYQQQILNGKNPCKTNGEHYVICHNPGSHIDYCTVATWGTTNMYLPVHEAPIRRIIGLKLYYNFSYNITREFYKVKFNKLRHYLCSHLQNYASNKGGVIQNGY